MRPRADALGLELRISLTGPSKVHAPKSPAGVDSSVCRALQYRSLRIFSFSLFEIALFAFLTKNLLLSCGRKNLNKTG